MNLETIALQDEGLRENSEQTLQTFTPEPHKKAARERKERERASQWLRRLHASAT
jgi:hypothetical protein